MADVILTEFSGDFIEKMKARMVVSFHKYGPISAAYPDKVDAVGSARDRVRKYAETGNTEYLVDAANFLMIEFMLPRHQRAHFKAEDSDASPGRREIQSGLSTQRRNDDI